MAKYIKLIFPIIIFLIIYSCSTENEICSRTGQIIDYNSTECLCCPGWIIITGQDTIKVSNLPIESQIWDIIKTSGFPIPVKLDYENSSGICADFYKKVTCIEIND